MEICTENFSFKQKFKTGIISGMKGQSPHILETFSNK